MPNLKRQWTAAERDELHDDGNRYEVIDGELFVTPAPSLLHQLALTRLFRHIADYLDREPVGHAVDYTARSESMCTGPSIWTPESSSD